MRQASLTVDGSGADEEGGRLQTGQIWARFTIKRTKRYGRRCVDFFCVSSKKSVVLMFAAKPQRDNETTTAALLRQWYRVQTMQMVRFVRVRCVCFRLVYFFALPLSSFLSRLFFPFGLFVCSSALFSYNSKVVCLRGSMRSPQRWVA